MFIVVKGVLGSDEHGGRGPDGQADGLPACLPSRRPSRAHSAPSRVRSYSKLSDAPLQTTKMEEGRNAMRRRKTGNSEITFFFRGITNELAFFSLTKDPTTTILKNVASPSSMKS